MKPGSDLQEARNPAANTGTAFGWIRNPAKYFEQRRLPRPISSYDA